MILLGSTGSIGVNALLVAERFSLHVEVLACGKNIALLNEQITKFSPSIVVVQDQEDVLHVRHSHVLFGAEGIIEAIREAKSDLVVNAIVGFAGLRATLEALTCKKKIALANKESLVAGGAFIDSSNIQPIDSEHFGLWYLLQKERPVERMVITASGGSFRDWPLEKLKTASLSDALKHPNWSMGRKITIDSASMVNKLFELLEARWLFGEGRYDAVMETKSLIHALIEFKDGSTTAHFAHADMKLPIAYALNKKVDENILKPIDLLKVGSLEFREIRSERYPIWELKEDILKNPNRGVIVNAANEVAIEQFIAGKIGFLQISERILKAYEHFSNEPENIEAVFAMDSEVRHFIRGMS